MERVRVYMPARVLILLGVPGVALYAGGVWIGAAVLAILVVAAVPAFIEAGGSSLRGLGWLIVATGAAVLLIDLTDRLTEWMERRRWGRRR